jgi:hypothetical protein
MVQTVMAAVAAAEPGGILVTAVLVGIIILSALVALAEAAEAAERVTVLQAL